MEKIKAKESQKKDTIELAVRVVTNCRLWKCPKCAELLEKTALGIVWQSGDPITKVAGTGTCSKCGATFPQTVIYGGRYDIVTATETTL